jgi:D-alanyl-D-alanine carboxypeptidase
MTRAANHAFIALIIAILLMAYPARADDLQGRLQALLDGFREKYGFPGATAAFALPDGPVLTVATGLADVEAAVPMTPGSRMLAASIGKTFVAATVLSLENDALLKRSDPVARYLGDRGWYAHLPNHATMTIADLLHHSAGIADHVHSEAFSAAMIRRVQTGGDALSPEAAIAFILDTKPLFPAGTGWAYSDTGYLLLGLVIEEAAGRSYYDLVSERFLRPLGLEATSPSDRRSLPGLAVGYTTQGNRFGIAPRTMDAEHRLLWDPAVEWTGGGLASTSRDLALWGRLLFVGAAMPEPYLERVLDGIHVAPDAPGIRYGAGVAIYARTSRGPVYGHGGWIPGYVSSLRYYADYGVAIAFQINTDIGIVDKSSDLVTALEAALADLMVAAVPLLPETGSP